MKHPGASRVIRTTIPLPRIRARAACYDTRLSVLAPHCENSISEDMSGGITIRITFPDRESKVMWYDLHKTYLTANVIGIRGSGCHKKTYVSTRALSLLLLAWYGSQGLF